MIELMYFVLLAGIVAMLANFFLLLAYKTGFVEWMQVHGSNLISKMAHCDFCMSWWLCVLITFMVVFYTHDFTMVFLPFVATPIARRLL